MEFIMLIKRDIQRLAKLGVITRAELCPVAGKKAFLLAVFLNDGERQLLYTSQNKQREFKSLDSAYTAVTELGLEEVSLKTIAA
tara:strand:+ start:34922 stop:35173 length:252 start_codon:yes stop_codon:yes gene_type:complete